MTKATKAEIIPPTWEAAVRIYTNSLRDPKASNKAKEAATEELLRLAKFVDSMEE